MNNTPGTHHLAIGTECCEKFEAIRKVLSDRECLLARSELGFSRINVEHQLIVPPAQGLAMLRFLRIL
ncbi:hypothetical protein [Adhaeretor mobilis]|uniref:hypothetical protein n=1 Tax=Adhaeretor mobilis TaxID=1930276 RepID=UPI0011A5F28B|nr:hypothetical protein [Adhaeretor mobilis]